MVMICIGKWGPAAWFTLHSMAHACRERMTHAQAGQFRVFLYGFGSFLPCPKCTRHFLEFLDAKFANGFEVTTRAMAVELMNDAHNSVNIRNGKPTWTLEEHYRGMAIMGAPPPRKTLSMGVPTDPAVVMAVVMVLVLVAVLNLRRVSRYVRM